MSRLLFRFLRIFAFAAATLSCLAADQVVFTRLGPTQSNLFIANADGGEGGQDTYPRLVICIVVHLRRPCRCISAHQAIGITAVVSNIRPVSPMTWISHDNRFPKT